MAVKKAVSITFADATDDELQVKLETDWGFMVSVAPAGGSHDAYTNFELEPEDAKILIGFLQKGLKQINI